MNQAALQTALDMDKTIMQLAAERDDLRAKLADAQAELDNLRIRAGLAEAWQPVDPAEIIELGDRDITVEDYSRAVRGVVYHMFRTPEGERTVIALPDNYRLCRRANAAVNTVGATNAP